MFQNVMLIMCMFDYNNDLTFVVVIIDNLKFEFYCNIFLCSLGWFSFVFIQCRHN